MIKRKLQIDVLEHIDEADMVECKLIVNGRACIFYMSESNYAALAYDGFFIRSGEEKDSAGVINTTHVYDER